MSKSKDLVLINSEIGTRDYYSKSDIEGKAFSNLKDDLSDNYQSQILKYAKNIGNLVQGKKERLPLRFYYVDKAGNEVEIDHADLVTDIMQITKNVNWSIQVIGGAQNFRQLFGQHALEVVNKPSYKNWKFLVDKKPGFGIYAIGPDKNEIIRRWEIKPSGSYPNTPPIVTSSPSYSDDPCWSNGTLHYTNFENSSSSPWKRRAEKSINPLFSLIVELLQKYNLGI